jgi:hypothetical protein
MMQSDNKSSPRVLLRKMSDGPSPEALAAIEKMHKEREEYQRNLPGIRKDGEAALRRLLPIAQGHSGQCRYIGDARCRQRAKK